ncbi:MAG: hypothetical protein E7A44_02135 [Peptoniphilus harei]|nr:hypothetical protein [Peptoniphilus harei]
MKKRKTPRGDGNFSLSKSSFNPFIFYMKKRKTPRGDGNFSHSRRFLEKSSRSMKKRKTPRGDGNVYISMSKAILIFLV